MNSTKGCDVTAESKMAGKASPHWDLMLNIISSGDVVES